MLLIFREPRPSQTLDSNFQAEALVRFSAMNEPATLLPLTAWWPIART